LDICPLNRDSELNGNVSDFVGDPIYMYSMGGLAEYCVVPANALAVIPESLPYSESAIIGCAVFTAYGAMKNAADMRAGETVAIIGTGGVGSRYHSPFLMISKNKWQFNNLQI
jgi:NADPH:quinone reductase-like Zn-dependent oxidoreductase